ncbi:MAG: hypothetical protein K0R57_2347 [Paenibacillaceae bacterium]|jgi:hypothetical protein|nr:hypothetical protein [Paenibacillaceae bacterium]
MLYFPAGYHEYKEEGISSAVLITAMFSGQHIVQVLIMFLVLSAAGIYMEQDCLGETGLKAKWLFIPKESIMGYEMVEGSVNEVILILSGKPQTVRFKVSRKSSSDSLEDILSEYFSPQP